MRRDLIFFFNVQMIFFRLAMFKRENMTEVEVSCRRWSFF